MRVLVSFATKNMLRNDVQIVDGRYVRDNSYHPENPSPKQRAFRSLGKAASPTQQTRGAGVKARKGFAHVLLIIPSKKWPLVEPLTIGSLKVETELYARTAFGRLDEYESPPRSVDPARRTDGLRANVASSLWVDPFCP